MNKLKIERLKKKERKIILKLNNFKRLKYNKKLIL